MTAPYPAGRRLRHSWLPVGARYADHLPPWVELCHVAIREDGLGLDIYWWGEELPSERPSE